MTDSATSGVTSIEITTREPYAEGRSFEGVGPYERLRGIVHFAVDPRAEINSRIVDLELAPRNDDGQVEFRADLEILAPQDLANANGTLWYDVNNRGRKLGMDLFKDGGDEFMMRKGYIVVWSGWIAELLPGEERLRLEAPVACDENGPLIDTYRMELIVDEPIDRYSVSSRPAHGAYPPTAHGLETATLTRRLNEPDEREPVPRDQWQIEVTPFDDEGELRTLPEVDLVMPAGLEPGTIYELIYEAEGSVVQGIGMAGIRDLISFFKHDSSDRNPLRLDDGSPVAKRAIGFGASQSGRLLRTMLYEGLNVDTQGRIVFDGLMPHVAGCGLGFFNHRFASPTRYATQFGDHLFPADLFPFAYGPQDDPLTKRRDGILDRPRETDSVPKIMHTQTSVEYWNRAGSLVHTDPLGQRDIEIPDEVRVYAIGGAQHGPGEGVLTPLEPGEIEEGQLSINPTDYRPFLRGLLTALDAWIRDDTEPPASRYPRLANETLVGWQEQSIGWQAVPGVRFSTVIHEPALIDFGEEFAATQRVMLHPPRQVGAYRALVAACGEDNNERGMLLVPAVAVPLATFTGWNPRHPNTGSPNNLTRLRGGHIAFAKTKAEREQAGDPRKSIGERYESFEDYRGRYEAAARKLVEERYLLEEDVAHVLNLADAHRDLF
jgi:hypothetical protein